MVVCRLLFDKCSLDVEAGTLIVGINSWTDCSINKTVMGRLDNEQRHKTVKPLIGNFDPESSALTLASLQTRFHRIHPFVKT